MQFFENSMARQEGLQQATAELEEHECQPQAVVAQWPNQQVITGKEDHQCRDEHGIAHAP